MAKQPKQNSRLQRGRGSVFSGFLGCVFGIIRRVLKNAFNVFLIWFLRFQGSLVLDGCVCWGGISVVQCFRIEI